MWRTGQCILYELTNLEHRLATWNCHMILACTSTSLYLTTAGCLEKVLDGAPEGVWFFTHGQVPSVWHNLQLLTLGPE